MTGRAGTRVAVATVLGQLAAGTAFAEVLDAYPCLEGADVRAALAYAAWRGAECALPIAP